MKNKPAQEKRILCKAGCGVTIKNDGREYCVMCEPTPSPSEWEINDKQKFTEIFTGTTELTDREQMIFERAKSIGTKQGIEIGRGEGRREAEEVIYAYIGKHNANILNEFQLQGKPDMPLIAYNETVCLIPAMSKVNETLKEDIKSFISKFSGNKK